MTYNTSATMLVVI